MKIILAIGIVAALTACVDRGIRPSKAVAGDSADQVIAGFATNITKTGLRLSHVVSDSAWIYQNRQIVDLRKMTMQMYDSSGLQTAVIVADHGTYSIREQSLDARGHVVATSAKGRILKTEHLVYSQQRNEITSDSAFTSTSPDGNVTGANFTADPAFKNVRIFKPKGGQKGKGFAVPGSRPLGGNQ
jgi:LPS export ABC transporter protein LptC